MPKEDYKKLGLKIGVEIHQQLDTHKLFCDCPSMLRKDKPDIIIKRKLYASAGETGKIDKAALYEEKREKTFVYEAYKDTTCLIELDEEPPKKISKEALHIAMQIALLLNAKPLPVIQVMRKTVIDGSNTSGFQRTALIAEDGWIKADKEKIHIPGIYLEEDAARIIRKTDKEVVFRLDRLGIPLVEISTAPDITSPEQAKEVALKIGEILRASKVKRGIGTIRQDINLSIKKGARTEIKGLQNPKIMEITIKKEIQRQQEEIKSKRKVEESVRNALPDGTTEFLRPLPGAARMYPETDLPLIKVSAEEIREIKKNLPKIRTEILAEIIEKIGNEEIAHLVIELKKIEELKKLTKKYNNPLLVAKLLALYPAEIAKHEGIEKKKIEDNIEKVIDLLKKKKISEGEVKAILSQLARGQKIREKPVNDKKIEEEIGKLIKQKKGLSINAYMGLMMKKFPGANGREIMEMLKKKVK